MNNPSKNTFPIYIYNSIEDEQDFIASFSKKEQKKLIHDSNRFADCYLFANSLLPSFTLISPIPISEEIQRYFQDLSGSKCTVLVPKQFTPYTCENIIADKSVFSLLVKEAKKAGSLTLYVYSATTHVFDLIRALEKAGVTVFFPEGPQENDVWTVSHFGSKSGFRKSFSPYMPKGGIFLTVPSAIQNAVTLFQKSKNGIVLKTDKGNAGQGVHIFKKSKIKSHSELNSLLKKLFKKEPFLAKHALVIEEFIDTSKEKQCPFPSIECIIHHNGRIEIPYYCNMIVTPEGEFYGMEMHETVFSKQLKKKIISLTRMIAKTYWSVGYRGRFDIDMVYDGRNVYVDESNTRINGGTDTYLIAKKLIGPSVFSKRYVLSSYIDLPKSISPTFSSIKAIFEPYLYSKASKTGLIINSESVIQNGGFTYILIGKDKKETLKMREIIRSTLTNAKKKQ